MKFKSVFIVLTVILIEACAIKTIDVSSDPEASRLVGKVYKLKTDAFLIKHDRCPDLDAALGNYKECIIIQAVGGRYLASSHTDFTNNPDYWNSYLCHQGRHTKKPKSTFIQTGSNDLVMDIIASLLALIMIDPNKCRIPAKIQGLVEKNTEIRINQIVNFPLGETGRCWAISGDLVGRENTKVQIPSCFARHLKPLWINSKVPGDFIPTINDDYLVLK